MTGWGGPAHSRPDRLPRPLPVAATWPVSTASASSSPHHSGIPSRSQTAWLAP